MARNKAASKKREPNRLLQAYRLGKEHDKWLGLILLGCFVVAGGAVGALGWFFIHPIAGVVLGVMVGLVVAMYVFGRRVERAGYARLEGRTGAAASALGILRRGWQVQTAVAVTKNQDLVHRVVGRPGVILVGEGNPHRVRNLLVAEKKKHARVVGQTPIYDIVVADEGENTVPVTRLVKHIQKLPRTIQPADVTDLLQRLKALDAVRPPLPMPKGPMPTSPRQARSQNRQSLRGR